MEINAPVHRFEKLKDAFFLVPDYQRGSFNGENFWNINDRAESFLEDSTNNIKNKGE